MKKYLSMTLLLAAFTLPSPVFAGDYSDAVATQRNCEMLGNFVMNIYDTRKSPKARKEAMAALDSSPDDDAYVTESKETMRFSVTYALNKATSRKDAYMTAWGHCMDKAN